jgi:ubiquinone biosynthesis protein
MQRVFGTKVTETNAPNRFLADTIGRALMADVLLSREPVVWFHADPHAGNLFETDDRRLAILDWSLLGQVRKAQLDQFVQLTVGAMMLEVSRIEQAVDQLASATPRSERIRRVIDRVLDEPMLHGPAFAMQLLDELALAGVHFPPELLLLRKTFLTLDGVIGDVAPGTSLADILLTAILEQFAREWPLRMFRPFDSRDFRTHLSSADIIQILASAPLALAQRLLGRTLRPFLSDPETQLPLLRPQ